MTGGFSRPIQSVRGSWLLHACHRIFSASGVTQSKLPRLLGHCNNTACMHACAAAHAAALPGGERPGNAATRCGAPSPHAPRPAAALKRRLAPPQKCQPRTATPRAGGQAKRARLDWPPHLPPLPCQPRLVCLKWLFLTRGRLDVSMLGGGMWQPGQPSVPLSRHSARAAAGRRPASLPARSLLWHTLQKRRCSVASPTSAGWRFQ